LNLISEVKSSIRSVPVPRFQKAEGLPEHLIALYEAEWAIWRWTCLRGAGFPVSLVHELAAPTAVVAADDLANARRHFAECKESIFEAIRHELDVASDDQERKQLARMLTQLNKGRIPDSWSGRVEQLRAELVVSQQSCDEAGQRFQSLFQVGLQEVSCAIDRIASRPDFRCAVLLQNRTALHLGIDPLLRRGTENRKRNKKERQQEELIANYVQRYCVKNDSIGFFGPIGWSQFSSDPMSISVVPGRSLIAKSTLYFENWCVEALAEKLGEDEALKPWMMPRQKPLCYLDGNRLQMPDAAVITLSPLQVAVLRRCRGEKTARQIALELVRIPGSGARAEEDVYRLLREFLSSGAIFWQLEIPYLLHAEKRLRSTLERIEDHSLRAQALKMIDELEQARERVSEAMNDPGRLDMTLGSLDEIFTRLTGKSSSRSEGAMYAARTLIYQDCLRDVQVKIGAKITESLGAPLSLVLYSARWITFRAAALYQREFLRIYTELARRKRSPTVDLLSFWLQAQTIVIDPEKTLLRPIMLEFQQRWNEILQVTEDSKHIVHSTTELRPKVEEAFFVPYAGWQLGRHHSPDVMIAAESIEAIQSGDYSLVLGELHMAINTVRGSFAMAQHPHPEQMFEGMRSDFPVPHVIPVLPKSWPGGTMRTSFTLVSSFDYHLEATEDSVSSAPASQTLPISALVVEHSADGLIVRSREHRLQFGVVEFFGELLSTEVVDCARMLPTKHHLPRITLDQLVICRESWSFPAEEIKFAQLEDESERFLAARLWQQENGLPRYVFVKVATEVKPCYLDFDSPIYVEIFGKLIRRAIAGEAESKSVVISEMLPRPDQLWLPGPDGQRYTCEFRTVVLDLAG
jgi:hypothetical protein